MVKDRGGWLWDGRRVRPKGIVARRVLSEPRQLQDCVVAGLSLDGLASLVPQHPRYALKSRKKPTDKALAATLHLHRHGFVVHHLRRWFLEASQRRRLILRSKLRNHRQIRVHHHILRIHIFIFLLLLLLLVFVVVVSLFSTQAQTLGRQHGCRHPSDGLSWTSSALLLAGGRSVGSIR
ncbi:hypothetical protein BJ322DRAFT_1059117 [Thelephora terrestris]|uniref:Uncharacterized protein n=1 Tax=Thelephora terrestris TaxID=56493 RepID=A0A9P6HIY5_9AGAM|nr:hypothetical protein BJ322DRAFT_1059117 [Thelephora terrestris]